jgi:hypothetical protein
MCIHSTGLEDRLSDAEVYSVSAIVPVLVNGAVRSMYILKELAGMMYDSERFINLQSEE